VVADPADAGTEDARQRVRAVLQPLLDQGRTPAEILRLVRSVLEP